MRNFLLILGVLSLWIPEAQAVDCPDYDADGYTSQSCGGDDCNDENPDIHPSADDVANDGIDQDCDGVDYTVNCDQDGDGHDALVCGGDDCNDLDGATYPGADDPSGDGVDQDCSGDGACEPSTWVQGPRSCSAVGTVTMVWLPLAALMGIARRREETR
jgi:hypothetical protein